MKLTKEDKKIIIKALSFLEQSIYNWSDDYLDSINKEYKEGSIMKAIDRISFKINTERNKK